jgi:hypothetical protein
MEDDMVRPFCFRTLLSAIVCLGSVIFLTPLMAQTAPSVAILGTHLQNDNEMYEPTSAAERARLAQLVIVFEKALDSSGQFNVTPVPEKMAAQISAGQTLGECGGCELDYGTKLGVDQVAWINMQKVSNLILNLNVYMADVKTGKMTFVRSVDIRGNTDETWTRSLNYLIKNYLLPARTAPAG